MKRIVIAIVLILAIVGGLYALSQVEFKQEVINMAPEIIEKEVRVPQLEVLIKEAQDDKRADVEREAKKAYEDLFKLRMTEIENSVIEAYQVELDARVASNTEAVQAY